MPASIGATCAVLHLLRLASHVACVGHTSRGLCVVKDNKAKEWKNRLQVLKEHVDMALYEVPEKDVDVVYDGWSEDPL